MNNFMKTNKKIEDKFVGAFLTPDDYVQEKPGTGANNQNNAKECKEE